MEIGEVVLQTFNICVCEIMSGCRARVGADSDQNLILKLCDEVMSM